MSTHPETCLREPAGLPLQSFLERAPFCASHDGSHDMTLLLWGCEVCRGVEDQILAVLLTVKRFWRPALINAVLPVILVFFLGMLIFFTDEGDLSIRLEVIVALFLALTGEAGHGAMWAGSGTALALQGQLCASIHAQGQLCASHPCSQLTLSSQLICCLQLLSL